MMRGRVKLPANTGDVEDTGGKLLVVGMGRMIASNDPEVTLITYSLGSCVAVAVYDAQAHAGGILHSMLPDSRINPEKATIKPHMFVDTGLPALFHAVYALGGIKQRMQVKVAGGAQFLDHGKHFNIGSKNIAATFEILHRNGVNPNANECGGHQSRTLRMELSSGRLTLESPGYPPRLL